MTDKPFSSLGLHPAQIQALREHKGMSLEEFGDVFGIAGHRADHWEAEGLSTGPEAVAVRAVAEAWSFEFPTIEGDGGPCVMCGTEAYHQCFGLGVCRSCYLTPIESMQGIGYGVTVEDEADGAELEVKAPPSANIALPPSAFGPEDWKTAVRKLRQSEHQTGFQDFDDLVYIEYIEPQVEALLKDETLRHLIEDLVPHGELELIGDAARLHIFKRNARPLHELVLRMGLLMHTLSE